MVTPRTLLRALACLIAIATGSARAASPIVRVGTADGVRIVPDVLVDPSGRMSIDDIRSSRDFAPRDHPLSGPESDRSVRWYSWTFESEANEPVEWFVDLDVQSAVVYIEHGNGVLESKRTGTRVPIQDRAVPIAYPLVVPVMVHPGERVAIWVRTVHDAGSYGLSGDVSAVRAAAFHAAEASVNLRQGLLLGSLLALALYNILLFLSFRDRSYIHYTLFLLGTVVYWGVRSGHLFDAFWPKSSGTVLALSFFGLAVGATGYIQFARSFLSTRRSIPRFDRVLQALLAGWGAAAALGLLGYWNVAMIGAASLAALTLVATLVTGLLAVRIGCPSARFYVLAALALVASGVTYAVVWLMNGQGTPSLWLTFQLSLVAEAVLLGLALAHRIRALHADRLSAHEELRRIETESEELQATNKMQTHVLGLAAHDLRSPLTGIMGFADLIEAETADGSEVQEFAGIIKKDADRMLALINDLLISAAIDGKSIQMSCFPMDLRPLISESANSFVMQAEKKGQTLSIDVGTQTTGVYGDAIRLRQVSDNLVSNAVKYTPPGGAIHVSVRVADGEVVASVMDNGPGLSAADKAHLFERFTRLSAQPTAGENSTGLGLSIVRELAELHGGRVDVDSEYGHGSTFSLVLPLHKGQVAAAVATSGAVIAELA